MRVVVTQMICDFIISLKVVEGRRAKLLGVHNLLK